MLGMVLSKLILTNSHCWMLCGLPFFSLLLSIGDPCRELRSCAPSGRALLPQYPSGLPVVPARGDSCTSPCVSRSQHFRSATLLWSFRIIALQFSCEASPGLGANRWRFQMQPSWNSHVFFLNLRRTTDLVVHSGILNVILVSSLSLTSPHFVNHHILFILLSNYLSLSLPLHFSQSSSDFKIKKLTGMPFLSSLLGKLYPSFIILCKHCFFIKVISIILIVVIYI